MENTPPKMNRKFRNKVQRLTHKIKVSAENENKLLQELEYLTFYEKHRDRERALQDVESYFRRETDDAIFNRLIHNLREDIALLHEELNFTKCDLIDRTLEVKIQKLTIRGKEKKILALSQQYIELENENFELRLNSKKIRNAVNRNKQAILINRHKYKNVNRVEHMFRKRPIAARKKGCNFILNLNNTSQSKNCCYKMSPSFGKCGKDPLALVTRVKDGNKNPATYVRSKNAVVLLKPFITETNRAKSLQIDPLLCLTLSLLVLFISMCVLDQLF